MRQYLKRWSSPIAFALTTLAVFAVVGTASNAFAQSQTGESSSNTLEIVGGGPLATRNDRAEARNGGNLLEVWRGANNNIVWMAWSNNNQPGGAFQVGATATNVAPAVAPWGEDGFMVFHTGTDGHIYFLTIDGDGHPDQEWDSIPGQTTQMPVSAAQMGPNSTNIYVVYRGFGNDRRIWGTWWFDPFSEWEDPENINNGLGDGAPTISYAPHANQLYVEVPSENNIWRTQQTLGASSWSNWQPILGQPNNANRGLVDGPMIFGSQVFTAVNENTDGSETIVMSALDNNFHPEYATFNTGMIQISDWSVDTTGFQTEETPELTTNGNSTYSLTTGLDDLAYWKQLFHR